MIFLLLFKEFFNFLLLFFIEKFFKLMNDLNLIKTICFYVKNHKKCYRVKKRKQINLEIHVKTAHNIHLVQTNDREGE